MTEPRPACTRVAQAVGWALHALEPDEEVSLERHLPTCPDCRAAVGDVHAVTAQLATTVEQVDPPPRLRASILDAVASTPQITPLDTGQLAPTPGRRQSRTPRRDPSGPRPTGPTRPGRNRRLALIRVVTVAATAVAVIVIGGLGVRTLQLQQQLATASSQVSSTTALVRDIARPGNAHALLAGPDGTAVAAVVVAGGQRTVYTIGLTPNSADQSYVLWGLKDPASAPLPLGVFDVDEQNASPQTVGSPGVQSFAAYAISLEPGRTPPAHPTDVVASGALAS
jgi:anti-sigma-K factor RskA